LVLLASQMSRVSQRWCSLGDPWLIFVLLGEVGGKCDVQIDGLDSIVRDKLNLYTHMKLVEEGKIVIVAVQWRSFSKKPHETFSESPQELIVLSLC
jgi:hypothetical protein